MKPTVISFHAEIFRYYKVIASSENYPDILSKLREEGIAFEPDNGSELVPLMMIEVGHLLRVCSLQGYLPLLK